MGTKVEKEEATYSVALTVVKSVTKFNEDSYDKSRSGHYQEEVQLASIDVSGPDWEALKAKLHAHIDLVG